MNSISFEYDDSSFEVELKKNYGTLWFNGYKFVLTRRTTMALLRELNDDSYNGLTLDCLRKECNP